MNVSVFGELNTFELFILCSLMPAVFSFLWFLITVDFKNFASSKIAYSHYTAQDPINCYQDYVEKEKKQD